MHANYFEGTLQLRNPTQAVIDFVEHSDAKISQVKEVRGGIDYYFVSQKALRNLGALLQKRFCGELKSTRRIFTRNRQTGKDVYRVTVMFRCYNVCKGQRLTIKGKEYNILAVGKKVFLQNIDTKEKKWFEYRELPSHLRES